MALSQRQRVQGMLERGWTCGIAFLNPPDGQAPILRYTGRIHEIRKDGVRVDRRPCAHPWHDHKTQMWEWRIPADDEALPGVVL